MTAEIKTHLQTLLMVVAVLERLGEQTQKERAVTARHLLSLAPR